VTPITSAWRSSPLGPLGTVLRFLLSRQVIRLRGQRLKRRLVARFLVPRPRHRGGVHAKIDLNESVDSSVDAFCHARKIGPQSPNSNDRQGRKQSASPARNFGRGTELTACIAEFSCGPGQSWGRFLLRSQLPFFRQ
jgi:hypothetical protein